MYAFDDATGVTPAMEEKMVGRGSQCPRSVIVYDNQTRSMVQTIPGKGWFMILRLYGPLEPWLATTGSAGATLVRSLLVVVTLGAGLPTSRTMDIARSSMAPALYSFSGVLLQSMIALAPWPSDWPSGVIFVRRDHALAALGNLPDVESEPGADRIAGEAAALLVL